ncbi:hypothetical protein ABGB17_25425 [Sphaerisporangium sp. B11E5]|uniref:hypothetical protein n=1 Tax=Sphaerisporangium sp. B11E5 TaxID=3153563 RepID=UPI00325E6075
MNAANAITVASATPPQITARALRDEPHEGRRTRPAASRVLLLGGPRAAEQGVLLRESRGTQVTGRRGVIPGHGHGELRLAEYLVHEPGELLVPLDAVHRTPFPPPSPGSG